MNFSWTLHNNLERSSVISLSHNLSQSQGSEAKFEQFHKSKFLSDCSYTPTRWENDPQSRAVPYGRISRAFMEQIRKYCKWDAPCSPLIWWPHGERTCCEATKWAVNSDHRAMVPRKIQLLRGEFQKLLRDRLELHARTRLWWRTRREFTTRTPATSLTKFEIGASYLRYQIRTLIYQMHTGSRNPLRRSTQTKNTMVPTMSECDWTVPTRAIKTTDTGTTVTKWHNSDLLSVYKSEQEPVCHDKLFVLESHTNLDHSSLSSSINSHFVSIFFLPLSWLATTGATHISTIYSTWELLHLPRW